MTESVTQLLADLGAERATSWDPAVLAAGAAARAHAIEFAASHPVARPGDVVAPFELTEVDDGALTLADLTADGPVVLLFFRFAGCGVCNLTLPHYGRALAPELAALGVPLVAISPQPVAELVEIKRAHDLPFRVASDADNALARSLGLTFTAGGRRWARPAARRSRSCRTRRSSSSTPRAPSAGSASPPTGWPGPSPPTSSPPSATSSPPTPPRRDSPA